MASLQSHHAPEDCLNCEHRHLRMFCNLTPEALADYGRHGIVMRQPQCVLTSFFEMFHKDFRKLLFLVSKGHSFSS